MDTPALLGIIFYLIATVYCEVQSLNIEEDWEMLYPEFIILEDTSSQDYPYQNDGNIPVFKKRSSDTDMNDYTVAVFYDDKDESIEAIYALVSSNYNNANAPTYYIEWRSEVSADSIISMSQSGKRKSIKCQVQIQFVSQVISCMPIEKIMKYTHNKDENIIKTWEGTEVLSIENYLKKFAIRGTILDNVNEATAEGLSITNLDNIFKYATGYLLPTETITIAVKNIKRTYNCTYLPFTEFCSHARELIDQIEDYSHFSSDVKEWSTIMAHGIFYQRDMEAAKATLVSYRISERELVGARTTYELWERLKLIVLGMTNTEFKLFADKVMQDYENYLKINNFLCIGEVEIGCLCETGW